MVGRGFDGCSVAVIALSVMGEVSVPRVGSLMNLLRCPAWINLSTKNFHGCPSIQFFHGYRWIKGKGLEERRSRPKASSEVL